ncbi:MAG: hypothetical protein H0U16_05220 [Actinobacteria bacterium]|nr:hypothetical protein [Actinomycetota bacterium]
MPTAPTPPGPIPEVHALVTALTAALTPAIPHTLTAASKGADVYEGYLMTRVLLAAMDVGLSIDLEDTDGKPATTLQLRTSPGSIHAGPYTHAVLSRADGTEELEVHTGVKVQGTSSAVHECDVLVIKRAEGEKCRRDNRHPKSSNVVWAVEAKFYVTNSVGIDKAREFFGLSLEMSGNAGRRVTLAVTRSTPMVGRMFKHHTVTGHFYSGVYPGQPMELDFDAQIRQVFIRHLA